MSDKGEIRFNADDRIESVAADPSASGGPGQVSNFKETTHRGSSSSPPPLDLLNFPDEFKSLEKDRLHPCDLNTSSPSALLQYDEYLHWFYYSHTDPAPVASLVDAASMCLDKERSMISLWVAVKGYCDWHGCTASKFILANMKTAIEEKRGIEYPFAIEAAKCIAKEAELISEWLRRGRHNFNNDECNLCTDIRFVASLLFTSRSQWSDQIGAALLGIRREAEWLIENSKSNSDESISTSMKIRQFAFCFVKKKFDELDEPYINESDESEMAFESDDESDDDVVKSKDRWVQFSDEDFLKYYGYRRPF